MDPVFDLISFLRPRATLRGGVDATGRWALSFHQRYDLLFCWVERGRCVLLRPQHPPIILLANDFVLVRTVMPFVLATDDEVSPVDSECASVPRRGGRFLLGEGSESPVTLHAGRFVFDAVDGDLLMELLPSLVHVHADQDSSDRVRRLLAMDRAESLQPGPGSEFVVKRLIELILVEFLRAAPKAEAAGTGLLAGLADPMTARALRAMHEDVAKPWTVTQLASLCAASRSTFAARFNKAVGVGPITYLIRWRIALAKDALRHGSLSAGQIGRSIGFQSDSAFSTAFTRMVGCSPTAYAASARTDRLGL